MTQRAAWLDQARQLLHAGENQRAAAVLERGLAQWPEDPQALAWLMQLHPNDAELAFRAGTAAGRAGQYRFAAQFFARALGLRPGWIDAQLRHADCLFWLGETDAAHAAYAAVLQRDPQRVDAVRGLRDSLPANAAPGERAQLTERICAIAPTPAHYTELSTDRYNLGDLEGCHAALDRALVLDPDHAPARWQRFQWPRWFTPPTEAEAAGFIEQWRAGLAYFEQRAVQASTDEHLHSCPAFAGAFHRHYLPDADAEQARYGKLLRALVSPRHPDVPPRPFRRGRKRIAIVTSHLNWHTVSRLFVPLLARLSPADFELHVASIGPVLPQWRTQFAAANATIHDAPRPPLAWSALLRELQPDAVVFPEVGLEVSTQWLACQRFAPVQIALWGHPVTTGLSSIDYFVSNEAMESADAQSLYTETLVRLPGFGHGFVPDGIHAKHPANAVANRDGGVDILCTQSLYKLLPAQDELFARVLAGVPGARLHLFPHENAQVRESLRQRMSQALARHGVDEARVRMHPLKGFDEWLALSSGCALHLDSLGFSGGMTSFDLCAIGLPAITLPGATMRSRQTAAMLQAMELPELVAVDAEDYVAKAVALANDPSRCRELAARIRERNACLWNGDEAAKALNAFLAKVTQ